MAIRTEPLSMLRLSGSLTVFEEHDSFIDSMIEIYKFKLYAITKVTFKNNYAYEALE